MKIIKKNMVSVLMVLVMLSLFPPLAVSSEKITIIGTVNSNFQIVTDDNQVFEVDQTPMGDEVVKLIGKKVKIVGAVEKGEGSSWLEVTSYEVIEK